MSLERWPAVALCLLLALGLAGCTNRGGPPPIWLAQVATLSGPDREAGESAAHGIRLAVEEVDKNADEGPQFRVIHGDTHGKLEAFESEAVRLVTVNRVAFLLGGTTAEEVARLDRAHATVVTPSGARPRGVSEAVFFTGLTPSQRGKALARFAVQELHADTVLLVQDERAEDLVDLAEALARQLPLAAKKDSGAPKARRLLLGKNSKAGNLALLLQQELKAGPVNAIIFVGRPEDLGELGEVALPVLFAGDEVGVRRLAGRRKGFLELYWVTAFAADAEPRAKEFADRFQKAFGEEPDVHAAVAYEDLKLLHDAIGKGKDGKRVRDELLQLKDFPGLVGELSFLKDRQLQRPALVVRLDGSAVKTVKRYPPDNG